MSFSPQSRHRPTAPSMHRLHLPPGWYPHQDASLLQSVPVPAAPERSWGSGCRCPAGHGPQSRAQAVTGEPGGPGAVAGSRWPLKTLSSWHAHPHVAPSHLNRAPLYPQDALETTQGDSHRIRGSCLAPFNPSLSVRPLPYCEHPSGPVGRPRRPCSHKYSRFQPLDFWAIYYVAKDA